jgi:putative membrane protein
MKFLSFALLITTLTLTVSCSSNEKQNKEPLITYNDAEIGQVLTTVNEAEIAMAQVVVNKSENEDVKEYAQEMIDEHKSNNRKTKQLMVDADMDMDDDSVKSQSFSMKAMAEKKLLERKSGKEMDKAYIEDQVETHKTVLKDLKETLIPQADNKELKDHLQETAKNIEDHLEHAQKIQRQLI